MSGFPSLLPALTVRVKLGGALPVGSIAKGTGLNIVPMVSGTVKSEPGFQPILDAELHGVGYDYIRGDVDGQYLRLDVRSQLKTTDGEILAMYYKGPLFQSEGVVKVLSGASDAKTTDYGDSFVTFTFETGSEKYKQLENMSFAAAGHFELSNGDTIVEYKVAHIVKG